MRSEKTSAGVRSRHSRPWRFLAPAFLVLTVFAGFSISGDSEDKDSTAPTISVPDVVLWGGSLYGIALDRSLPITVTATTIAGVPLAGSPESSCVGGSNNFCFPVPNGSGLSQIRVTATDAEGNTRVTFVLVR